MPLSEQFVFHRLGLVMVTLYIIFEVSACRITQNEVTKGNIKCINWGGLGWLGSLRVTVGH